MASKSKTELSNKEVVRAATNAPELSERSFTLGDREFKVVDLEYDAYVKFLTYIQPILEVAAGKMAGMDDALSVGSLIQGVGTVLPQIVQLIVSQTDPDITVADVKRMGKSPIKLAQIVIVQVEQNNVIKDIADFFKQILPLLKAVKKSQ